MIAVSELVDASRIVLDLPCADKGAALGGLCARLQQMGLLRAESGVLKQLLERETLMTTAVRRGFAFPHAFNEMIGESFLSLGVCPQGVDFNSLDGSPTRFIFLLLGPPDSQSAHLHILARISRLTIQDGFYDEMAKAGTAEEFVAAIRDAERNLRWGLQGGREGRG